VDDRLADAGAAKVALEGLAVRVPRLGVAHDLARPAVVAGVRIDRDHLRPLLRRRRQDDRRAAVVAADLDDPPAGGDVPGALEQARAEQVSLDKPGLGFTLQKSLNAVMERLAEHPQDWELVRQAAVAVELANSVGLPVNLWHAQNLYYDMAHKYLPEAKNLPHQWLISFLVLAEKLCVLVAQYKLPKPTEEQEQLLLAS